MSVVNRLEFIGECMHDATDMEELQSNELNQASRLIIIVRNAQIITVIILYFGGLLLTTMALLRRRKNDQTCGFGSNPFLFLGSE